MTADSNDFVTAPAQEKLEWVTPKISLMEAENTEGGKTSASAEDTSKTPGGPQYGNS